MLLAHDAAGAVVFQLGTSTLHPDGPPDEALPAMFAEVGAAPVGWVRLHDEHEADLVQQVLRRGARVEDGEVVLGPEPESPAEPPAPGSEAPVTRAEFEALQHQLDLTTQLLLEAR